jgi:hypothetical protein
MPLRPRTHREREREREMGEREMVEREMVERERKRERKERGSSCRMKLSRDGNGEGSRSRQPCDGSAC